MGVFTSSNSFRSKNVLRGVGNADAARRMADGIARHDGMRQRRPAGSRLGHVWSGPVADPNSTVNVRRQLEARANHVRLADVIANDVVSEMCRTGEGAGGRRLGP